MISLAERITEAQRELALRRRCYPQWIKNGRLSMEDANKQLLAMQEICRTLMRLDVAQRQLSLFGQGR